MGGMSVGAVILIIFPRRRLMTLRVPADQLLPSPRTNVTPATERHEKEMITQLRTDIKGSDAGNTLFHEID